MVGQSIARQSSTPTVEAESALTQRRRTLLAVLACAVCFVIAFHGPLFGGKTFNTASTVNYTDGADKFPAAPPGADHDRRFTVDPGASAWAMLPWSVHNSRTYHDGEVPLWNPYAAAGAPHLANIQSAPLDPLLVPVHAFGTIRAWDLSLLLAYALALVFAFVLGRVLGLGALGTVVCSVGFGLSGFVFVFGNNHWARPYLYIPVLLTGIEWGLAGRRLRGWLVTSVGVALLTLAGMPEVTAVVAIVAGAYLLARLAFVAGWSQRLTLVGCWASASAVGLLVAMPALLPFFEYLSVAYTKHGADAGSAQRRLEFGRLINLGAPFLGGYPVSIDESVNSKSVDWTGMSVIVLAVIGFAGGRRTTRPAQWAALAGVAVMAGMIYDLTYLNWTAHLPGIERVAFIRFGHPALVMMLVVLAGFGVRRIADGAVDLRRAAALIAGVVTVLALSWFSGREAIADAGPAHNTRWILLAAAGATAIVVLAIVTALKPTLGRFTGVVGVVVVCAEVLTLAPTDIYPERTNSFAEPAWLTLIREQSDPLPTDRYYGDAAKLAPSTATALLLQDVRVVDAVVVKRYWNLIQGFVEPEFTGTHFGRGHRTRPRVEGNPVADLLGIRYHLTDRPLDPTELATGTRLLGVAGSTYVYERETRLPRAFTVRSVTVVADEPAAHDALARLGTSQPDGMVLLDRWDPRTLAVVEVSRDDATALGVLTDGSTCEAATATITNYEAHRVDIEVEAACAQLLVLSDTYYPGWKASVNGERVDILPANISFRSVVVPTGRSTVTFEFTSRSFGVGWLLSLIGLIILFGVPLGSWIRRRQSPDSRTRRVTSQ